MEERALSQQTVGAWTPFVIRFLTEKFADGPLDLPGLKSSDVTGLPVAEVENAAAIAATRSR